MRTDDPSGDHWGRHGELEEDGKIRYPDDAGWDTDPVIANIEGTRPLPGHTVPGGPPAHGVHIPDDSEPGYDLGTQVMVYTPHESWTEPGAGFEVAAYADTGKANDELREAFGTEWGDDGYHRLREGIRDPEEAARALVDSVARLHQVRRQHRRDGGHPGLGRFM